MRNAWLLASLILSSTAWVTPSIASAQDGRIYRCGNEYTNRVGKRKNCTLLEGGNVTVVKGTAPAVAVAAPPPPSKSSPRNAVSGATPAVRANSPEQRARDSDARAILAQELRSTESRQADLLKEYNNGEPEKQGGEARNHQKYLDRVADLKASIDRNQSDIEGIRRELNRFK